ncbi:MAG: hypothetical protein FJ095_16000 [Deltaproteobacteria bacterium]|nr:hypothetical protein [Deltaproteobacteria bacterium]
MDGRRTGEKHVAVGLSVLALAASSCVLGSDGLPPVPSLIYYPTGLAVSAGRTALYVANSDFDLKYTGGSVQLFDARALRSAILPIARGLGEHRAAVEVCAEGGLARNDAPYLNPGPCEAFPVGSFLVNSVFIGAFASRLLLTHNPNGEGARLFSPVRGDPSLTYIDVEDDRVPAEAPTFALDCNVGADGFCGNEHRVGRNPERTLRGIQLPPDPVGTASSVDGTTLVTAHQTQGAASLVANPWSATPFLAYYASNYASGPTDLAAIPRPAMVDLADAAARDLGREFTYRDGFVLTYRGASQLDLVEHFPDSGSIPPRPFLVRAGQIPLNVSSSNVDSRGIVIVSTARRACEQACGDAGLECLARCAEEIPLGIYVANRNPASLLVGRVYTNLVREAATAASPERITAAFHTIAMHGALPLDFGPAHVKVGQVVGQDGSLVDRVFALAFDSRSVFIVDPRTDTMEAVVRTGRGPQELAIDSGRDAGSAYSLGYVAHFTDSYLGVIDLDLRRPATYGQFVASVGEPLPPAEAR